MRILIVDDSRAMRMIVKRTLRQAGFGQHSVEEASDGKQAWEMTRANPPDLILSDWNMPEMSGFELLGRVRQSGVPVKFGFVTSEGTPEMRAKARDAGALFLIAKPITAEKFETALQEHVIGR